MAIDARHPREIREDIRNGKITGVTAGLGAGHVQTNLAVLPKDLAYDFLLFCQRNPRPCPLLEVTEVGSAEPVGVAPGADLRTDIARYRLYKDGVLADEVTDATPYWRDNLVAFLLGCSFTFEWALLEAGIDLWHVKHGKNVAMWRTSIECRPAGVFHGPMVVSMRPIPSSQLAKAVTASARFPGAHGAPIHIGDPAAIGIKDVTKPDWGDPQVFAPGDVPVFWACGVTPQAVALASKPSFMLTHSPGHMFITDLPNAALAAL
ncbi:MAG TPA: putative hydro-lyase [Methylomirabilota bacterium]|nr:putative hydro-lyase [Methylomirabilota bacterium]